MKFAEELYFIDTDSDLTPYSFVRADLQLRQKASPNWNKGVMRLFVSPKEDRSTVEMIKQIADYYHEQLEVYEADIPEYAWLLSRTDGKYAIYSDGA